jgi:hypothetical protein
MTDSPNTSPKLASTYFAEIFAGYNAPGIGWTNLSLRSRFARVKYF